MTLLLEALERIRSAIPTIEGFLVTDVMLLCLKRLVDLPTEEQVDDGSASRTETVFPAVLDNWPTEYTGGSLYNSFSTRPLSLTVEFTGNFTSDLFVVGRLARFRVN